MGDGGRKPDQGFLNVLNSFSLRAHFGFGHSSPDLTHRHVSTVHVLSAEGHAVPLAHNSVRRGGADNARAHYYAVLGRGKLPWSCSTRPPEQVSTEDVMEPA